MHGSLPWPRELQSVTGEPTGTSATCEVQNFCLVQSMPIHWFSFPPISLPSLAAPSSIQRRFISFILKRSLGHFVKPGQLNADQIDAQIGNGVLEVKNVELDCTVGLMLR